MKKLAIITTHPIQYYAPVFKLLHERKNIEIRVFYTLGEASFAKFDPGFGKAVSWDIPLLEGYPYAWATNIAKEPGTRSFKGIINPLLTKQVNDWQPDAVLIFGWAYNSHLKALRYFSGKVPVYFRGDSTLLNEKKGLKSTLKYLFLKWVYGLVDHAFYVGKHGKDYFLKYGLTADQLSFAPHAIDNERFTADRSPEAEELRLSLNLNKANVLVLFAGKFEPVKNVALLLAAFMKISKPNVHLLLVGNGIDEAELKKIVINSNCAGNIHFLDFKNQTYMPVLYQACDLFCLPSKSESWGLSVNEAMACGKAVLVSDKVGCAPDLVKNGENGAVFSAGNVDSLAEYLLQLTKNKDLLAKFGEQSRNMIKDWNFTNIALAIETQLLNEAN